MFIGVTFLIAKIKSTCPSTKAWISFQCLFHHTISNKKDLSINILKKDASQTCYTKCKMLNVKGYSLYDSIYTPCLEQENYRNKKTISGCQELDMGKDCLQKGYGIVFQGDIPVLCND